ncbi:MAG: glycosyltransferase [Clostridia bacterium]|nr:glycosyltransferase [Clostridia bacterium]
MDYKYKISLIIPCYNSEVLLSETLDNLLGQTLKDIQLIIVNDGSTDSTTDIIADYAAKNSNILCIEQKNAGVAAARNNGLNYVEGKYTMFADSDDLMSDDALEQLYNALEESGADVAICRAEYFGYGGKKLHPQACQLAAKKNIDVFDRLIIWNFMVSNKCYRSDFLKASGVTFPLKRYAEDGAFCMQIFYQGAKLIGVENATMYYRRRKPKEGFSVTQTINYNLVEDMFDCIGIVASAAQKAFERPDCTCEDKEGYLQELYRKAYSAFVLQFYPLIWSADEKTMALMKERFEGLVAKMTPEALKVMEPTQKHLNGIMLSKKQMAENPYITVIAKNPTKEFVNSLYAQSMPHFELITTDNLGFDYENIVVLPEKGFAKAAKKAAKGVLVITESGATPIADIRLFKVMALLKKGRKFRIFPSPVIRLGANVLLKIR